jgi:Icc-related predicted phosphoesterase
MLDGELRPVTSMAAGGVATGPAGSTATRRAIERFQPFVGLHGHIHESNGMRKIGRTSCFNPGSEYGSGILRGVVLVLDAKRGLKDYMFSTG